MASTLGTLKEKVVRLLGDVVTVDQSGNVAIPVSGTKVDAQTLDDAVRAALSAVSEFYPARSVLIPEVTESTGKVVELPSDFWDLQGVLFNGYFVEQRYFRPGFVTEEVSFTQYPSGFLTFSHELANSSVEIYYTSSYPFPDSDEDDMPTPVLLDEAISLYAASYCLLPQATTTGTIRQYGTEVDSGNPTHNPLMDMSSYFMKRYAEVASRLPKHHRGTL